MTTSVQGSSTRKRDKNKVMLISNHNGSLLRQQPEAAPGQKRLELQMSKAQSAYALSLSCTYLAHHELESVLIITIIIIGRRQYLAGESKGCTS